MMILAKIRAAGGDVLLKPGGGLTVRGEVPPELIEQCKQERKSLVAALEREATSGIEYCNSKYYISLSVLYDSFQALPFGSGCAKTIRDIDDVFHERGVAAGREALLAGRENMMQMVDRALGAPQDWGQPLQGDALVAEIRTVLGVGPAPDEAVTTFNPQTKRQPFVPPVALEVKEQRDLFAGDAPRFSAPEPPKRRFEP